MRTVRFPNRSTFSYVLYGEVHMLAAKNKVFALLFCLWTATIFSIFVIWNNLRLIDFRQASPVWPRFGQVPFALATSTSWNSSQLSCDQPCVHVPETPTSNLPPQTPPHFMQIHSVRSVASTMRARSRNVHIPSRPTGYSNFNSKHGELTPIAPNYPQIRVHMHKVKDLRCSEFDMLD